MYELNGNTVFLVQHPFQTVFFALSKTSPDFFGNALTPKGEFFYYPWYKHVYIKHCLRINVAIGYKNYVANKNHPLARQEVDGREQEKANLWPIMYV